MAPGQRYHRFRSQVWSAPACKDRVTIEPDLSHGEPCIRGTRIGVAIILGSLADGMSEEGICEAYPQLTLDDIRAALAYAAEAVRFETLAPLS